MIFTTKTVALHLSFLLLALSAAHSSTTHDFDLLSFTSSDSTRAGQLSQLLQQYYNPSNNRNGATLANGGYAMPWFNFAMLGNMPIGAADDTELLGNAKFSLVAVRFDSDGYVYQFFNAPFWNFPTHIHSQGLLEGWEFDGTTTEDWTSQNTGSSSVANGRWTLDTPNPDPQIISPTVSVEAADSPFIDVTIRCLDEMSDCEGVAMQVFWQRTDAPTWHTDRSIFVDLVGPEENFAQAAVRYAEALYEHPEWSGTVTKLRIDPVIFGSADRTIEIDRVAFAFDARVQINNFNYVLGTARYYFSSGDETIFTETSATEQGSIFDRARIATNYMITEMGGEANDFIKISWPGHDARPGIVNGTVQVGHGIQGSIYDALPMGNEDAYASVHYYAALKVMAALEREVADNLQWGVAPNPFGESSASYDARAAQAKIAIDSAFWLPTEGRLAAARDSTSTLWDIGHVGLNLEAVFYDAVTGPRSLEIMDWISGQRSVTGDLSQGADIYKWQFGPRVTTRDTASWYVWPMYIWFGVNLDKFQGAQWEQQVQNGGGWFWQSFYDVVNRHRIYGPDNAWQRVEDILDWYQDVLEAGGFVPYYDSHPANMQGCNSAGTVGLDCEFIENGLVPLSVLYAFLGYDVSESGLKLAPRLPSSLSSLGVERLHFRNHFYSVEAFSSGASKLVIATMPDTGLPGFSNSPHTLPLSIGALESSTTYRIKTTDFGDGSTTESSVTTDPSGTMEVSVAMPASGKVEILAPDPIFSDDFESGDTDRWSGVS